MSCRNCDQDLTDDYIWCTDCGGAFCDTCASHCDYCDEEVCYSCGMGCELCDTAPLFCTTCQDQDRNMCTECGICGICDSCLEHHYMCNCCGVTKVPILSQKWICQDCKPHSGPIYCEECKDHDPKWRGRCHVLHRHKTTFSAFCMGCEQAKHERITEEMHPDVWVKRMRRDEGMMERWKGAL